MRELSFIIFWRVLLFNWRVYLVRYLMHLSDATQDDSQRRFLAQHSVATLLRWVVSVFNIHLVWEEKYKNIIITLLLFAILIITT